jgi:4-methylaminobutanoate oxidase (formaldehyde-forming)
MAPFLEKAMARVPVTLEVGVRTFFCGPESFTPDLAPPSARRPASADYFVAAGHELRRRALGRRPRPGAGALDHDGRPDVDVTGFDVDALPRRPARAGVPRDAHHRDPRHRVRRAHPGQAAAHGRGPLLSPVHDRLVEHGGYLREVSGWEGADWFAGAGRTAQASRPGAGARGSSSGRRAPDVREAVG